MLHPVLTDNRQRSRNIIVLAGRFLASGEPTLANGPLRLRIDGLHPAPGPIFLANVEIYLDIENVRLTTQNARLEIENACLDNDTAVLSY
jgi:hypothetical protein